MQRERMADAETSINLLHIHVYMYLSLSLYLFSIYIYSIFIYIYTYIYLCICMYIYIYIYIYIYPTGRESQSRMGYIYHGLHASLPLVINKICNVSNRTRSAITVWTGASVRRGALHKHPTYTRLHVSLSVALSILYIHI